MSDRKDIEDLRDTLTAMRDWLIELEARIMLLERKARYLPDPHYIKTEEIPNKQTKKP